MLEYFKSPVVQQGLFSLLTIVVAYIIRTILIRIINKQVKDLKNRYTARKTVVYILSLLTIIIIIFIWAKGGQTLATLIGLTGAGLALALHQPVTSIAGWLLLLIRRPYETGDRVEIGGVQGDVIDIRLFYTSLLEIGNWVDADQSTGRIVHCPNAKIFTEPIFNFTSGFEYVWHEIKTTITFESDWRRARDIILQVSERKSLDLGDSVRKRIQRLSKQYLIHYEKLTPIVWTKIVDFGVELTLRYLTDARKRRSTQHEISQAILDRFSKEPDIELAYPTYRIYKKGES
ncbi:mechanosensitive ion channel family protein [Acidobacteriota bacterium]